jgi:hypothetical protein
MRTQLLLAALACAVLTGVPVAASSAEDDGLKWIRLFAEDGVVQSGWAVRDWADVSKPPSHPATWEVRDGVLRGTGRYSTKSDDDKGWVGTWLLSEREYGDFVLEAEFRFQSNGERGNGGIALRAPLHGDPAYDGLELQITDERYERSLFPNAAEDELTGSLYLVKAPASQAYRPGEWNRYRIDLRGPKVKVWLNDTLIQDVDLDTLTSPARRHGEGTTLLPATPGAQRPRRGHIGFQDLSDSGEVLLFRNVRIAPID